MEASYEMRHTVLPSLCDWEARLSVDGTFGLCMDIATAHAQLLGVGAAEMQQRGLFWLTVKTRMEFFRRPAMMEEVRLVTRPIRPERVRALRDYALYAGRELLVRGKTEWAVMNTQTGRLAPMQGIFSPELELAPQSQDPTPFDRLDPDFSRAETVGSYRVCSTDIDLGGHMNNVAYLRAMLGLLSTDRRKTLPQDRVELIFRVPCFEGEVLTLLHRPGQVHDFALVKADGTPAVLARFA